MAEIESDLNSDIMENEKCDFDLAFSPVSHGQITKPMQEDEEVFFSPVGFTEQCITTQAKTLQKENIIPLSPLTGEQYVEVFKEARKLAIQLKKLSSEESLVSSSSNSSHSSSILKLSSDSDSPSNWLTGKVGNRNFEETTISWLKDKENVQPLNPEKTENLNIDKTAPFSVLNTFTNIDRQSFDFENGLLKKPEIINFNKNEEQFSLSLKEKTTFETKDSCEKAEQNGATQQILEESLNGVRNESVPLRESNISGSEKEAKLAERKVIQFKKKRTLQIPKAIGSNLPMRTSKLPRSKNTEKSQSAFKSPIRLTASGPGQKKACDNEKVTRNMQIMNQVQSVEKSTNQNIPTNSKLQKSVPSKLQKDHGKDNSKPTKPMVKRNIFNSSESLHKPGKECQSKLPGCEPSKIPGPKPRRRRSSSLSSLNSSQSSQSSHTSPDNSQNSGRSKLARPSKIPTNKANLATSFGVMRKPKLPDATADNNSKPKKALPPPRFMSSAKNSKADAKLTKVMLPPPKYVTPSKQGKISKPMSSTRKRRSAIASPDLASIQSTASRLALQSSGNDIQLSSENTEPSSKDMKSKSSTQTVDDLLDCDNAEPIIGQIIPLQPQSIEQPNLIDFSGS